MKSPIKDVNRDFKSCISALKNIIPKGSTIKSFLFFGGSIEFNLAEDSRFVSAHTTKYVIYEFWKCLLEDRKKSLRFLAVTLLNLSLMKIAPLICLTRKLGKVYTIRSSEAALFFLLNRCSETGIISSGN